MYPNPYRGFENLFIDYYSITETSVNTLLGTLRGFG